MSLLSLHIARTVFNGIVVVLFAFIALVTMFALVEELGDDDIGYSAWSALSYIGLTMPRRVYELLPYAAFIGALVGLGQLASHSELLVMRSAGYSKVQIFLSVCLPATGLLLVGFALGEFLAPVTEERANALKTRLAGDTDAFYIDGGHWYREGGLYVSIDGIAADSSLRGIVLYELDDNKRVRTIRRASSAVYAPKGDAHIWQLQRVVETKFSSPSELVTTRYDTYDWRTNADPRLLSARALLEPRRMSLQGLFYQVGYMQREGLAPVRYELALYAKLFQPFAVIGLCLVALSFILGPLRERGIGVRLAVGILVGLMFKYLQDLFGPVSMVYELPAWLGVLIPIILCWLLGFIGFRRIG